MKDGHEQETKESERDTKKASYWADNHCFKMRQTQLKKDTSTYPTKLYLMIREKIKTTGKGRDSNTRLKNMLVGNYKPKTVWIFYS